MVYLPHGGGRQPPGRLGVALGSWVAAREGESSRRCPSSPWRWLVVARAARSSQGNMEAHVGAGGHQERREQPTGPSSPPGGGWQPPGRPGAALGSWVATKGGKSGRWYIFPMEAAGSRQASPELSWRAGWPPWKRRADGCTIFHMEAAARPARSCPGELVATRRGESRRMCHLPHGGGRKPYKERSQVIPDSFPLPLDPIKGNGIRFLLLVCVWPGLARITTTPFIF